MKGRPSVARRRLSYRTVRRRRVEQPLAERTGLVMTPLLLVAALAAADIAMGLPSAAVEFGVPVCAQQQQQTACSPPQPALDRGCRQPLTADPHCLCSAHALLCRCCHSTLGRCANDLSGQICSQWDGTGAPSTPHNRGTAPGGPFLRHSSLTDTLAGLLRCSH